MQRELAQNTEEDRELMCAEMHYGVLVQILAMAPEEGPMWLVAQALTPEVEHHLIGLGWQRPQRPEGASSPPPSPS